MSKKATRPLKADSPIDLPEGTASVTPLIPLPIPDKKEITKDIPPTMISVDTPIRSIPQPSSTTEQEDLTTAGQRRINLIWEHTQAFVAIVVVTANMVAGVFYAVMGRDGNIPAVLSSSLFLVIGFYFSRTNHASIGGLGPKPNDEYKGR